MAWIVQDISGTFDSCEPLLALLTEIRELENRHGDLISGFQIRDGKIAIQTTESFGDSHVAAFLNAVERLHAAAT